MRHRSILAPVAMCLSVWLATGAVSGEVRCTAEVGYEWRRGQGDEELKVHRSRIAASGEDEATAKSNLAAVAVDEKAAALKFCRGEHENFSGCLGAKLSAAVATMQALDFSARKALEEAITADCKALSGACTDAYASEPACVASASSEGEGKDKKDEGKESKAAKKK